MATPTKPLNNIESPSNFTLPLHLNLHDDIKPTTNKEDISSTPDKPSPSKDVYRIPSYSSWFSWDKIHETECKNLPEFFDGKNTAKNAMVYKEYRDLMMSKCKENPLRKITFTEVRRMLVGDVNTIRRVFDFLENWGLINYQSTGKKHGRGDDENGAASNDAKRHGEVHRKILCNLCGVDCSTVRFDGSKEGSQKAGDECLSKEQENSAINKNSGGESKSVPRQDTDKDVSRSATKEPEEEKIKEENIEVEQSAEKNSRPSDQLVRCPRCDSLGTKFCYYNNYNLKQPRHFCKNCQRHWTVGGTMRNVPVGSGRRKGKLSCSYYWYAMKPVASITNKTEPSDSVHHRAGFVLCANCYSNGNFGPGLSAPDFKRVDMKDANQHKGVEWTDNETLLLLQALLAYKDDWKSVAHCVGTKSEAECVAKFVQLPIGEQYISDDIGDRPSSSFTSENSVISHVGSPKDLEQDMVSCDDKNCLDDDMSSSLWPKHLTPLADANNPIMAEASFLAAMAGPHIAEIAARAAINALGQDSLEMLDITTEVHKVLEPENSSAATDKEGPEKDPVAHDEQQHNNNNDNLTMAEAKGNDDMDIATEHIAEANGGKKKRLSLHDAMKFKTALLDAKSSVDEEYKNTELLYSSIVDNQIIKLQEDLENFEELEKIVEKEKLQLKQIEDLLVADRIRLVQEIAKE